MMFFRKKQSASAPGSAAADDSGTEKPISDDLDENINTVKNEIGSTDLIINYSQINTPKPIRFACVYISNMISNQILSDYSTELGKILISEQGHKVKAPTGLFSLLSNQFAGFRRVSQGSGIGKLTEVLLSGELIFLIDGHDEFLSIDAYSPDGRAVAEPSTQSVVRGPKEGFTESLGINIALIRKRLRDKALKAESLIVGTRTKTKVALMYISDIAKPEIVDELRRRIGAIKIDGVLESGYIEEMIKDNRYSIFPTFLNTEKPDTATACLLEGKVAILVDGTPFVLTAPTLFAEFFQASEDYYHQFHIATLVRLFRYTAFVFSMFIPAIYITLANFHQEMVPTPLLINIIAQHEGTPFPTTVEVLLMQAIFEILREGGIRTPRVVGSAIAIVGALVLGQAAVDAGIISDIIVIIVAITTISNFAIPNYAMGNAARLVRFTMIFIVSALGFMGLLMGAIALLVELCRLKSVGVPYMSPFAPKAKTALKDTFIRFPLWKNTTRPEGISADTSPRVGGEDIVTDTQKEQPEFR